MVRMKFDKNLLKSFARVHAHLCGDGGLYFYKTSEKDRINRAELSYFNTNEDLIKSFRKDMKLLFNVKMTYHPEKIRLKVKSLRIAKVFLEYGKYGTREWRIPDLIKNSTKSIKLEWIKALSHDEGYTPLKRNIIRIKSMNSKGLKDTKNLLDSIKINSWITGQNSDGSWYLNIRKEKELSNFTKQPSRRKIAERGFEPPT
ncbi:hypothetical protein ISS07_02535 [Candidatus Woesearchaeota archaeon]|nr:hypothetical protein [Candidatus Woesearchaeota archaeon]